jgi:hypothetical protein
MDDSLAGDADAVLCEALGQYLVNHDHVSGVDGDTLLELVTACKSEGKNPRCNTIDSQLMNGLAVDRVVGNFLRRPLADEPANDIARTRAPEALVVPPESGPQIDLPTNQDVGLRFEVPDQVPDQVPRGATPPIQPHLNPAPLPLPVQNGPVRTFIPKRWVLAPQPPRQLPSARPVSLALTQPPSAVLGVQPVAQYEDVRLHDQQNPNAALDQSPTPPRIPSPIRPATPPAQLQAYIGPVGIYNQFVAPQTPPMTPHPARVVEIEVPQAEQEQIDDPTNSDTAENEDVFSRSGSTETMDIDQEEQVTSARGVHARRHDHSDDGSSNRKRAYRSVSLLADGKRRRITAVCPIIPPPVQPGGIPAHLLAIHLKRIRKFLVPHKGFSELAEEIGDPKWVLPAVHQTLQNAFDLARTVITAEFIDSFDWERHSRLDHQDFVNDIDTPWMQNLDNLEAANKNSQTSRIQFRVIEYQQKFLISKEIARRTQGEHVTLQRIEHEIYREVVARMDLSQGTSEAALAKSKKEVQRLHLIDQKHVAFICSRPSGDKWKSILRNERGSMSEARFLQWVALVGPACEHIWRVQTLLATQPIDLEVRLRKIFIDRDVQCGISYSVKQWHEWKYTGTDWISLHASMDFESAFNDGRPYPGTKDKSDMNGITRDNGAWEVWGYGGDYGLLRSWALTLMDIGGIPSLVTLVDLQEGDYLGSVSGNLHYDNADNSPRWVRGPPGIEMEPTRGPLWSLFSPRSNGNGNIAVTWQPVGHKKGFRTKAGFEFHAFVVKPIKALEVLVVHEDCLVG